MDFGSLRSIARDCNFWVHGLPATITLTTGQIIATRVIWLTTETEDVPVDEDNGSWSPDTLQRRDPIRALVVRRDEVPALPRGSVIQVPERGGDQVRRWLVDGHQRTEADQHRVIVIRDPNDEPDED